MNAKNGRGETAMHLAARHEFNKVQYWVAVIYTYIYIYVYMLIGLLTVFSVDIANYLHLLILCILQ